jgi:hypothetical protein
MIKLKTIDLDAFFRKQRLQRDSEALKVKQVYETCYFGDDVSFLEEPPSYTDLLRHAPESKNDLKEALKALNLEHDKKYIEDAKFVVFYKKL